MAREPSLGAPKSGWSEKKNSQFETARVFPVVLPLFLSADRQLKCVNMADRAGQKVS